MSELGKDAKIPDLWRKSALLDICPKEPRQPHGEGGVIHDQQDQANMTDDTLMIVAFEPMKIVEKLKRKSLRAPGKSGHHSLPGRNHEVSGVVHSAVYVLYVNTHPQARARS